MKISVTRSDVLKSRPPDSELGFGKVFTDHMFNMDYSPKEGWHNARIEPYSPLIMDPASMVLHYGQGIFEGLKAYASESGDILLFRPDANFSRLNDSCRAMCMPEVDEKFCLNALKELLTIEREWTPRADGTSLYIRPSVIGTDSFLGVRPSDTYRFFIILSPVGAYYASGFDPVKIWVSRDKVRAIRGGVGCYKTIGNYGASLYAAKEAQKEGYEQVLWLDGVEREYVEEVGSMNIFFVIDGELATPELSGSILPGITRDSILKLARSNGMVVSERKISMTEMMDAYNAGKLEEVFGSGTAAVVSPVGEIKCGDEILSIGDGAPGPVTQRLFRELTDIQYGRVRGPEGWSIKVA